jgi:hydroxymethylpyrimidine/phosphomethylpyrimidine kinase
MIVSRDGSLNVCTTAQSCQISLAPNPSSDFVCAQQTGSPTDDLSDKLSDGLNDRSTQAEALTDHDVNEPTCVMVFNANDPSGAAGLSADVTAVASVGAHPLPVVTGAYSRDTSEILDHFPFDDEVVTEQARTILEDIEIAVFKVGFVGTPENVSAIAEIASDYSDVPLIAYMPDLSWWSRTQIEDYLDAFKALLLPQATVLAGNHSTLWRWLLPDWNSAKNPTARDIAQAAQACGTPYTLVTGIALPDSFIDNVLASPQTVLASGKFERFEAVFCGAGDTLSAALCALLATGSDLPEAVTEALGYLDRSLHGGFRPGMGHVLPDRLFWAQSDQTIDEAPDGTANENANEMLYPDVPSNIAGKLGDQEPATLDLTINLPNHATKH